MARQRRAPKKDLDVDVPQSYIDEYGNVTASFRAAYKHAIEAGNTPKSALLFADAHQDDAEFGGDGD